MAIRTLKLTQNFCFARQIRLEVESRIKREAESKPRDSAEAIMAFQELLLERRERMRHEERCPICKRNNDRFQQRPIVAQSVQPSPSRSLQA